MCDYSAEGVKSRSAVVGDVLVSDKISTHTTGFVGATDKVAVCLLPGTELAFAAPVRFHDYGGLNGLMKPKIRTAAKSFMVARFAQVDMDKANTYHDALEFPDGDVVMLHDLILDQQAKVLQLPAPKISADGDSGTAGIEGTDDTVVQPHEFDLGSGLIHAQPVLEIVRG